MSYYPIELDKVRNFRYGMRGISRLEKKFKTNVNNIDLDNLTMEEQATFIWAGLVHEDDKLTPDKVMDLVDEHSNLAEILPTMLKAFAEAMGGKAAVEELEKHLEGPKEDAEEVEGRKND